MNFNLVRRSLYPTYCPPLAGGRGWLIKSDNLKSDQLTKTGEMTHSARSKYNSYFTKKPEGFKNPKDTKKTDIKPVLNFLA